jgi:hypothetical protein
LIVACMPTEGHGAFTNRDIGPQRNRPSLVHVQRNRMKPLGAISMRTQPM